MPESHREELESVVADYIERYGVTEKARAYFKRIYNELIAAAQTDSEHSE